MATKQEITNEIRKNYGDMLNIQQVTKLLGYSSRDATKKFMEGVPCCDMGKEKKYLATDIAKRIYNRLSPVG